MKIQNDILRFLILNPNIEHLDFTFLRYAISPKEYRVAFVRNVQFEKIIIRTKEFKNSSAGASYDYGFDLFELSPKFSISNWRDQALLIHECTHAVIDMKKIGHHSGHEDEAVAYLAEAIFLESSKKPALTKQAIRTESHKIAQSILNSGNKKVPDTDAQKLVAEVARHPMYKSNPMYNSNRFEGGISHTIMRIGPKLSTIWGR